MTEKVNLAAKLASFSEPFSPRIVAELNNYVFRYSGAAARSILVREYTPITGGLWTQCAPGVRAGSRSGRARRCGASVGHVEQRPVRHARRWVPKRRARPYAVVMVVVHGSLSAAEQRVIERWIEVLREEIELESVWLFGSRARNEQRGDSDVDLLVITRGDPERDRRRVWKTIDDVARAIGVNPAVFVPHTWDRAWLEGRREIRSFFIQEVDRDKVVLFGGP
jgi:predicted nucleotidyltransferase